MTTSKTIGILLFDGVEELDAVGPWEVLAWWTLHHPEDGYEVVTLAETDARVTCAKGLRILPDLALADAPQLDVVVYPGGQGTRAHLNDPTRLEWVRRQRDTASIMASVCTGALVYAAAGLLAGRPATTHWSAFDELAAQDPTVVIERDVRFVDDGDVITSAGVSAGIDMALHLVDRLAGRERAVEVRRGIQYDPEPPV
ncbi:putative transcription regulator, AraC family protein [Frondihabitans sucicola]|uniref:Transcription regulator, AraC family protein n=1 Tax=Frondihabitans sucicola TaxID=1268041 RepID=A0ABN6XY90_9MICO|nr:DJ-1/PfpI family protein [Frondihabitans sucicola]BDZ49939.1 putative transcription regulator, AraC family protein [Frondihabitans sucicola]